MKENQCMALCDLLSEVKGLREQLTVAVEKVKVFFKRTRVERTPEAMEQIANVMRVLYGTNAVVGVSAQGSITFTDAGAKHFYYTFIAKYLPKLRSKPKGSQGRKANPEKMALGMAKRMKAKYGAAFCRTLGALLMS